MNSPINLEVNIGKYTNLYSISNLYACTVFKKFHLCIDGALKCDLWTGGILCAFEFVRRSTAATSSSMIQLSDSHWVPIGWKRIFELVTTVRVDSTVVGVIEPYSESSEGPMWWCHLDAEHLDVRVFLKNALWLHQTISTALTDVNRSISECSKNFMYQVPIRMAGGLLFELLGHSVDFQFDNAIVLRSWHNQNFLVTVLHATNSTSIKNVIGITKVQKLLLAGGSATPKSMHEVIAHLACRISEWDDRVFRISNFVAADEIELKFANRRSDEDLTSLNMILHEEIKNLRTQVIGVKWALHAREVIVFELLQYLGKTPTKCLLERIITNTRKMLEELEAVRGRLFNIEHFLQSTVNTKLQDQSLRITHYMTVFGGPMLLISLVVSIFGVNLDGIPGTMKSPYAFSLFCGILILVGIAFVLLCMHYFRLKNDTTKEEVNARRLEHQQLISMYRRDLETQAKIR